MTKYHVGDGDAEAPFCQHRAGGEGLNESMELRWLSPKENAFVSELLNALRACMYLIDVSDATVNAVKAKAHAGLPGGTLPS